MATELKKETLQDIMALREPERTVRLQAWVEEFDEEDGDTVLLKPVKGSGMQVMVKGKKMSFPPRGQRVGRRRAIPLMRDYGPNGKYVGVDRKTGMTASVLQGMSREDKQKWGDAEFDFDDNYLIHVPSGAEEEVGETENNG